uniref:Late embryogenesis abundant protein LEA-2 subgroup domain-containing protein n=1 Tax=Brassica campestris TaxID=3711 RepID=M4CS62_BRACM
MKTDDKKEKPAIPMLASEAPKPNAAMETQSTNGGGGTKGKKRNRKICICVTLLILLLIFVVLLVLGLTLFKPKRPITTIDSVAVDRLQASVDVLNLKAPLPARRVGPENTLPMNITLTLMADRLLTDTQIINDVMSGSIPINTFVKVAGKVSVLKIFKIKVQSSSSCDIVISVANRNVTSQHCKYSTKL